MKRNKFNIWGWIAAIVWMICTTIIVIVFRQIAYLHLLWLCWAPLILGGLYHEENKNE